MLSRRQAWVFGVGVVLLLMGGVYLIASFWPQAIFSFRWKQSSQEVVSSGEEWAMVARVIDGDTIELENGEKLRYIGINTPESVDPRRKVECFGKESAAFNKNLVEGKRVRLEKDISERDKYGRLLRFVFLEDGTLVNEVLVREGYAHASPYTPDISRKDFFREAESDAKSNHRGLWSAEICDGRK